MVKSMEEYEQCEHIKEDVIQSDCINCHVAWCHKRIEYLESKDDVPRLDEGDNEGDIWIINKDDDDWMARVESNEELKRLEFTNFYNEATDVSLEDAKGFDNCEKIASKFAKPNDNYKLLVQDMCDDDTEIRKLARKVLSEYEVEGDSYGVPCIVDVVELLVNKILKRNG